MKSTDHMIKNVFVCQSAGNKYFLLQLFDLHFDTTIKLKLLHSENKSEIVQVLQFDRENLFDLKKFMCLS